MLTVQNLSVMNDHPFAREICPVIQRAADMRNLDLSPESSNEHALADRLIAQPLLTVILTQFGGIHAK